MPRRRWPNRLPIRSLCQPDASIPTTLMAPPQLMRKPTWRTFIPVPVIRTCGAMRAKPMYPPIVRQAIAASWSTRGSCSARRTCGCLPAARRAFSAASSRTIQALSSSLSQRDVAGVSGSSQNIATPSMTVGTPSRRNSHCHPRNPPSPSRPSSHADKRPPTTAVIPAEAVEAADRTSAVRRRVPAGASSTGRLARSLLRPLRGAAARRRTGSGYGRTSWPRRAAPS